MTDNPPNPPSRLHLVVVTGCMIAAGIWLSYLGVTDQFDGPPWVAYVLGLVWLTGGVQLLATGMGRAGFGRWVVLFWLAGFTSLFWWVALAGDPQKCAASIGSFSLPSRACNFGFGLGAVFFTAYTIFVARVWYFPRRRSYY